ncbi:MAG TPA: hypothetical protein VF992_05510 [Thermoplasmata archaeon]
MRRSASDPSTTTPKATNAPSPRVPTQESHEDFEEREESHDRDEAPQILVAPDLGIFSVGAKADRLLPAPFLRIEVLAILRRPAPESIIPLTTVQ